MASTKITEVMKITIITGTRIMIRGMITRVTIIKTSMLSMIINRLIMDQMSITLMYEVCKYKIDDGIKTF